MCSLFASEYFLPSHCCWSHCSVFFFIISTSLVYNANTTCVLVEYASCKISVLGSLTIFILSITGVLLQL